MNFFRSKSLFIALLLICFTTSFAHAQFLSPKRLITNYEVNDLQTIDMDNDGLNDLFINSQQEQLLVYRKNLGGGEYGPPKIIFDALAYDELFELSYLIMDKDLDGDSDIILVSWTKLIILENHNGYFEPELLDIGTTFYGDDPHLTAHDPDNDGDLDIFIHDSYVASSNTIIKAYQNQGGDFVFTSSINLIGFAPTEIDFYDYDQDGNKDLLVYKASTDQLRIYNYLSPFSYSGVSLSVSGVDPLDALIVADFEDDGDDDILAVSTCLTYFRTNGPSNLSTEISTECNNWRPSWADFNNDGFMDAVSFDDDNDSLQIYANNGTSLQLVQSYFLEPMNLTETYVGDANSDGLVDVLTVDQYSTIRIYLNQGSFSFLLSTITHPPAHSSQNTFGNINGDDKPDFLTASPRRKLDGTVYAAFRIFNDIPDSSDVYQEFVPIDSMTYYHYKLVDVDGDGLDDILALQALSKDAVWFKNQGGYFDVSTFIYDNNTFMVSSIEQSFQDIDLDGDIDLITYDNLTADFVFNINDGAGNFTAESWDIPFAYNANMRFKTCNLDNDNLPDFIFWYSTTDEARVFQSQTINTYDLILFVDSTVSFEPMLVIDIDQDSTDEIVIKGQTDYYILNVDSVSYSLQMISDLTSNNANWIETDYDYDGFPEILAPQYLWEAVFIYPNDSGFVSSSQNISFGAGSSYSEMVDFDSDSDYDLYTGNTHEISFINENIGLTKYSIVGSYFLDLDENGIYDGSDVALNRGGINLAGSVNQYQFYPNGSYKFYVDSGSYDMSSMLDEDPFWIHTTDSVYNFSLSSSNYSEDNLDFGVIPDGVRLENDAVTGNFGCVGSNVVWLNHLYIGTAYETLIFQVELDAQMAIDSTYFPLDSIVGSSLFWSIDSVGNYSSATDFLIFHFDPFVGPTIVKEIYFTIYGLDSLGAITLLNVDTLTESVTCSFDPNDKNGYPFGVTDEHYILANQDLTYTIRFQNTGTDTAHTVMLADYLSDKLNWSSFEFISSSYPCEITISPSGLMLATFNNIMLPDSNANEPESHGFLKFKISQQPDLSEGLVITNQAEIYFDLNEPVITNTAFHTIYSCSDLSENLQLPASPYCENEWLELGLNPVLLDSVLWTVNGVYFSDQTQFGTDTLSANSYNIQLLAWNPLCILDSLFNVTIHNEEQVSILNGATASGCGQIDLALTSTLPTENEWFFEGSSIGNSDLQLVNQAGVYFVSNGVLCPTYDSIVVSFYPVYQDTINQVICEGDSALVGGIYFNTNGYYHDTLFSINGCDSVLVTQLNIAMVDETITETGFILTASTSGATYQWIDCSSNMIISGEVSQTFSPAMNGIYAVIVGDGFCSDTSECIAVTGLVIPENVPDQFKVHPNPASSVITIAVNSQGSMIVRTLAGEIIYMNELSSESVSTIDCSQWAAGSYLFQFVSENGTYETKIVITH